MECCTHREGIRVHLADAFYVHLGVSALHVCSATDSTISTIRRIYGR